MENNGIAKKPVRSSKRGKPTPKELALLNTYKASRGKGNVVVNELDKFIEDNIKDVQEAVNNMVNYGDPNVFRLLPSEVDEHIKKYGMKAQEYFVSKRQEFKDVPVDIVPQDRKRCPVCGKYYLREKYYTSYSDISDGYAPICIDCCRDLFNKYLKEIKDIREVLILMCQKLDIVVLEPILSNYVEKYNTPEGKQDILNGIFFGNFLGDLKIQIVGSQYKKEDCVFCKTNFHGEPFRNIDAEKQYIQIYNDELFIEQASEESGNYPTIKKLKKKWGDMEDQDLYWLEDKFNEWYDKCEIDGLAREKLVMQLCYEELRITRIREKGSNPKDEVKAFQSLMKDSDLTPKKQVAASSTSNFSSLGEFIKCAERSGPIVTKNASLKDVDGFERLWRSVAGAISRTLGKENKYVTDFEQFYKDYTVDILESDKDSDGDEDGDTN